jgi:hypothetical protein
LVGVIQHGMELGAAAEILPLDRIADAILKKLPTPQGKKV